MANKDIQTPHFWRYMAFGYLVAFTVEYLSAASGDSQLFKSTVWPTFFLVWYGILFGLSYLLFRNRPLWQIALFWAVLGPILEMLLFRGHFRFTDIFYSLIFVIPFWLDRRI